MDSNSDDSWSTLESCSWMDSGSELECSTCSSSDDEDCSYKRETSAVAAIKRPEFARTDFALKEKLENDLEDDFAHGDSGDEEPLNCESRSSSSCSSGSEEDEGQEGAWGAADTRRRLRFSGAPSINTGSAKTPLDYFYLIFSRDFVQFLADTINARGKKFAEKKKKSYLPTDVEEVYTLLSTHFMMGFTTCIAEDILWGRRPSLNVDFNTYLRKERYLLLFTLLTYRELKSKDGYRSWYDVAKPIADRFNIVMKSLMVPGKNLNIEKETVLCFNEKNEMVRRPERIRLHLIADDNGIFQRVFLVDPELQQEVRGDKIVSALMEDFLDSGRSLFSANMFYLSVPLAEYFLKRKTYVTGVLKKNRPKNPNFLKMKPEKTKLPIRVFKREPPVNKKAPVNNTREVPFDKKAPVNNENNSKVPNRETTIIHGFNKQGVCIVRILRRHLKFNMISTEFSAKPATDKQWECEIIEETFNHTNLAARDRQLSKCGPQLQRKVNRHVAYILQAMCINAYLIYKVKTGMKMKFVKFLEEVLYQMLPLDETKGKENAEPNKKPGNANRRNREQRQDNCIVN